MHRTTVVRRLRGLIRRRPSGDGGFTLAEVMVSMTVMTVVMSSVTAFFVSSIRVNNVQAGKQLATRVAESALERVRSIDPGKLLSGRTKKAVEDSLATVKAVVPAVTGLLSTVAPAVAYDVTTDALTAAQQAALQPLIPVLPVTTSVGGSAFAQTVVIGNCTQAITGGACLPSASDVLSLLPGITTQAMYKVVVAVTWKDRNCGSAQLCSTTTSTLVGNVRKNPVFNNSLDRPAPTAGLVADRTMKTGIAASVQLSATTTTASPLTWTAYAGLPPGLAGDAGGKISGTPTTAGLYPVVATVRDNYYQTATTAFVITVITSLTVTDPGNRTGSKGVADSLTLTVAGGTLPYTWSATGLPPGLSVTAGTGKISGTPTTVGTYTVTAQAADVLGATGSVSFTWTVVAPLALTAPGSQSSRILQADSLTMVVAGGTGPYTWSATGLPTGLSINSSTGRISGTPTAVSIPFFPFTPTVKVVDSTGAAATVTFNWTVTV